MKRKYDLSASKKQVAVKEPALAYGVPQVAPLALLMGSRTAQPSDFDLLNLARTGVTKRGLVSLAKQLMLTLQEIADILHISERTLQRYTPATLVKTEHADRAIELAKLYERGIEVLGSQEAFNRWLRQPNYALNNQVPLHLLDTTIGFRLVLQVLGRIEYGVFS